MSTSFSWPRTLLATTWLLAAGRVPAQEPASSPFTLTAVLQRVTASHPVLTAQRYRERAAEALIEQSRLRLNPHLEVTLENFVGTGPWQGISGLEGTAEVSQTLERGDKRQKRIALATREREAVAREGAVAQADVRAAAALAYVEVLAAQQRLALAGEPLQLARDVVAAVEARVQAGADSPAEAARARAALAAAQAAHARAGVDLTTARAALAASWGGLASDVPSLPGELRVPEVLPEAEVFRQRLSHHPRLDQQQAIIAGRRAAWELERAQAVSDIAVAGGVRFFRDGTDAAWVAGVSVPLSFRNKNQGNIRAARETLTGAEQTVAAIEVELRAAFTTAWQQLVAAYTAAEGLRRDALPATEEAHAIVQQAYEQGQLPLIDVLDAQRTLAALRRELLDQAGAYAAALVRLEALTDPAFSATSQLLSSP